MTAVEQARAEDIDLTNHLLALLLVVVKRSVLLVQDSLNLSGRPYHVEMSLNSRSLSKNL